MFRARSILRSVVVLSVASLLVLAVPAVAHAAEYWIDAASGNDATNPGTESQPFKSITKGMSLVSGVTTLHVATGVYSPGNTDESLPLAIVSGARIVGAGAGVTTLTAGGSGRYFTGSALSASTRISDVTFTGCSASGGGAIYLEAGSAAVIERCRFVDNQDSGGGGGALHLSASPSTVRDCVFSSNTAMSSSGGALVLASGAALIERCVFEGNAALSRGGAIWAAVHSGTISRCRFIGNSAGSGGAITFEWGTPTVSNCLFAANSASDGGALFQQSGGTVSVLNCTIAANSGGGGVGGATTNAGVMNVKNSIVWGNGDDLAVSSVTYSCVEDADAGTGVIHTDPRFASPPSGDFSIRRGSPCVDSGTDTGAPAVDMDGAARPADGDRDGTATTDMGAYEVSSADATIHVALGGSDLTGAGSEANPFASVTMGMSVATPGDTVYVHEGEYSPGSTGDAFPIVLKSGVHLSGESSRTCVLDAQDTSTVVRGTGVDTGTVVSELTITGGGGGGAGSGHGVLLTDSTATISSCIVTGNVTVDPTEGAAGITVFRGSPLVGSCTVGGNSGNHVGGIYLRECAAAIVRGCTVEHNSGGIGAGVTVMHGTAILEDDLVEHNTGWQGGGVLVAWSEATTVTRNVVRGNTGQDFAGGVYTQYCSPWITDNLIVGNTAGTQGGGVLTLGGGTPKIWHNTIVGNTAPEGGGVAAVSGASASVRDCILRDNGDDLFQCASNYSAVETTADRGATDIGADPLFVDAPGRDYRLRAGSPCIDIGEATPRSAGDLVEVPRPQDGDWNGVAVADMGAYESVSMRIDDGATWTTDRSVSVCCTFTGATAVRVDGGGGWSEWMAYARSVPATLTGPEGTVEVEAQYAYADGRILEVADEIVLDETAPQGAINIETGARYTVTTTIDATLSCGDATYMRISGGVDAGAWLPAATATRVVLSPGEGTRTLTLEIRDEAGNTGEASDTIVLRPAKRVTRHGGSDRYAVAAGLASWAFPGWSGVTHVIIASGEDRAAADPLSAAGLAGSYDAPVLLVNSVAVPSATYNTVRAIAAANPGIKLLVVGGTASVPKTLVTRLDGIGGVNGYERFAGADRYAVANGIALRVKSRRGGTLPMLFVANGESYDRFYDALAAGPILARNDVPLLLTKATSVPSATRSALAALGVPSGQRYVVGDKTSVADSILDDLDVPAGNRVYDPALAGRYGTAAKVAAKAASSGWLGIDAVGIANKLPDALTGGAAMGRWSGPLLYTPTSPLNSTTRVLLESNAAWIGQAELMGGTASVSDATSVSVSAAINR